VGEKSTLPSLNQRRSHQTSAACSAGAETIVYDRGLLLLVGLV